MEIKQNTTSTGEYAESCAISKNYQKRTQAQSATLYSTIQDAVETGQVFKGQVESDEPLLFLTEVFKPLILKSASIVHKFVYKHEQLDDVIQQGYVQFLELVYAYDPSISQFSYYIKSMLERQLRAWSKKQSRYTVTSMDSSIINNILVDPSLCDMHTVYIQFNELILRDEMQDFMEERANRKARSATVKEVCYKYFLGTHSCKKIAEELDISYHAVYEVIKRIEKEYRVFLEQNSLIGF
jgi:RNA polymerase sigma factor (sigma-70 family)